MNPPTLNTEIDTAPATDDGPISYDISQLEYLDKALPLPKMDDPILTCGPDIPCNALHTLKWLETKRPSSAMEKLYEFMAIPKTLIPLENENLWDAWARTAHDPKIVEAKWREFFGDDVPVMSPYELWAIVKNVHDRLLHWYSEEAPPPSMTDCYDPIRGCYWRTGRDGRWKRYTEKQYRQRLFRSGRGFSKGPGGAPSQIESDIEAVTERQATITEGMSGYLAGLHDAGDRLYLARYGFKMIEPDKDILPAKTLAWLEELLGEDGMHRFLDWLCHAVSALLAGRRGQSRILAIAGPSNSGKSFLIREIVRLMLGGRAADAAPWLLGATEFASELGGAELLYVDDALGDGRLVTRLGVASKQKQIVTAGNKPQPLHAKGKDRYYHQVWWRHAVALNDTPEALAMLPPLDDGYSDKLILLRANETVLSVGGDGTTAYIDAMLAELPGFMAYVLDRGCLGTLDGRGPLAWQDPELVGRLLEAAPEYSLAGMIAETLEHGDIREAVKKPIINPTLRELDRFLRDCCGDRYSRLCPTDQVTRKYLGRLEKKGAVTSRALNGRTRWILEKINSWLESHHSSPEALRPSSPGCQGTSHIAGSIMVPNN